MKQILHSLYEKAKDGCTKILCVNIKRPVLKNYEQENKMIDYCFSHKMKSNAAIQKKKTPKKKRLTKLANCRAN